MVVSTAGTIVTKCVHPPGKERIECGPLGPGDAAPERHPRLRHLDFKEVCGNVLLLLTKKPFFLNFFINFRHLLAITFVLRIQ